MERVVGLGFRRGRLCRSLMVGILSIVTGIVAVAFGADVGTSAVDSRIRAVQLDLARQMETPGLVSNFVERAPSLGLNTVQLYLEARASTSVFSMPAGEGYSPELMAGWVRHAEENGIQLIPVVSLLAHAELFFANPGLESLSEEAPAGIKRASSFCLSNPATRDFLERHVSELCRIFKGPYFHVGFDESWNFGRCPRCRPKVAADGGDALFIEFVRWANDLCRKNGKRMVMWDDQFGFHPSALGKIPSDVVFEHWNYTPHVSGRGTRFNFGGHFRRDWLADYAALGHDALTVPWQEAENIRTMVAYGARNRTRGFLVTNWENMQHEYYGGAFVRAAAAAIMDSECAGGQLDDAFLAAARHTFPSLSEAEAAAVAVIVESAPHGLLPYAPCAAQPYPSVPGRMALELAVKTLSASALRPCDGDVEADVLSERARLDDLVLYAETSCVEDDLVRAAAILTDPRRTAEEVAKVKEFLAKTRTRLSAIASRRAEHRRAWRPVAGRDMMDVSFKEGFQFIDRRAAKAGVADGRERRIELALTLVDYYGHPVWTVDGRFGTEWRQIAHGSWKPRRDEWAAFSKFITFESETFPDAIRISYSGKGAASLRYVQVESRDGIVRPVSVLNASGLVQNAANLLVDDTSEAVFGDPDACGAVSHPERAERVSSVVLGMSR